MKFQGILKFDKPVENVAGNVKDYYLVFGGFSVAASGKQFRVEFAEGLWWCKGDRVYITGEHPPYKGFIPEWEKLEIYREMETLGTMLDKVTEIPVFDAYLNRVDDPKDFIIPASLEYLKLEADDGTVVEFHDIRTEFCAA